MSIMPHHKQTQQRRPALKKLRGSDEVAIVRHTAANFQEEIMGALNFAHKFPQKWRIFSPKLMYSWVRTFSDEENFQQGKI